MRHTFRILAAPTIALLLLSLAMALLAQAAPSSPPEPFLALPVEIGRRAPPRPGPSLLRTRARRALCPQGLPPVREAQERETHPKRAWLVLPSLEYSFRGEDVFESSSASGVCFRSPSNTCGFTLG